MHLINLFGPPAVGKMSVGREIAARTPYRLFHNHATIEPLLEVFDWEMPSFGVLKAEFRRRVIEEAVASELPGLIFTYVWALELPEDAQAVTSLVAPVVEAGGKVDCVELYADMPTRLSREGTPERLAAKPSKRDTEWARANVVDWNERHVLSTGPEMPFPLHFPHTVVDNTRLSAAETAEEIITRLGLPTHP
ncbi:hypothetical protein AB0F44_29190 [Nocardioides sp. NPDC023903]|uniref:hypothetical protein n=1 Tax=Nocardioides sp. NPDC023903 TaxID=3157195 RepID=UPI0033E3D427